VRRWLTAAAPALAVCALAGAPAGAAVPGPADAAVDRTIGDPRITESSGLAAGLTRADVLWTHDDSGNPPVLFALGPSGRVTGTVRIAGVPDVDWEAMAAFRETSGRSWLAVADIGDNEAQRAFVEVDVVPEPARPGDVVESPRLRLRLRYPDGPRDAETLLVDAARRRMFVVSKGVLTGTVYAVPASAWDGTVPAEGTTRSATLVPVGTVPLVLVTDGTVAPDGTVLLRTYGELAAFDPFPLEAGIRLLSPRATAGLPSQQQGEGLALAPGGRSVLLSSEGADQPVLRFALSADLGVGAAAPTPSPTPTPTPPDAVTTSAAAPPASTSPPPRPHSDPALLRTDLLVGGSVVGLAAVAALAVALGVRRGSRR
jgi:hypothetical protein